MKALYVDDPISEPANKDFFDKKYLMIRKQAEKKKKKKLRRMRKPTKK